MSKELTEVQERLNKVSSCFCLAKWLQVSVHLQNGHTHSCHHPQIHKIPLDEIKNDPSALHNTKTKKEFRRMMLEGKRPSECEYCWKIEDAHPDNISDRIIKSYHDIDQMDHISKQPWDKSINPSYLEVSFGNECNFKCAYCAPHISSAIMLEYQKFGPYKTIPFFDLENLKAEGLFPYQKDEHNPYVDAFWNWWPDVQKDLKLFRITGGEPLINSNTFKFLDYVIDHPMPNLELAINSNLGIPKANFEKFISKINHILDNKLIKKFSLYTSLDTHGKNAEFIRFGLNYDEFMNNVHTLLTKVPGAELNFMCTYNVFSVLNFRKFLEEITHLKNTYRNEVGFNRVYLDIPYLRNPVFLSCYVLTDEFKPVISEDLAYMKSHAVKNEWQYSVYSEEEVAKFERILNWLESIPESNHRTSSRRALYHFIKEYQERKGIQFTDYCPEYLAFYNFCKLAHLSQA